MKKLFIHGKFLVLLFFASAAFSQNKGERELISQTVNRTKLQEVIDRENRNKDFQQKEVERLKKSGYQEFLNGEDGSFSQLIGTDTWGNPLYLQTMNQNVVNSMGADVLHSGFDGLNLTGHNMTIGLWEAKNPRLNHEILRVRSEERRVGKEFIQLCGSEQYIKGNKLR